MICYTLGMSLTHKQETFARAVAAGMNHSEAYREAYNAENMGSPTIASNAYKLVQEHTEVAMRIAELKSIDQYQVTKKRAWTVDRLVDESEANMAGAREDHQWSAANGAVSTIGKALGILTDKVDVNVTHAIKPGLTLEELEARVIRLDALEAGIVDGKAIVLDDDDDEHTRL